MHRLSQFAAILGCAATLAFVGCSTNSGSGVAPGTGSAMQSQAQNFSGPQWIHAGGVIFSKPHIMRPRPSRAQPAVTPPPGTVLTYYGGPVLTAPKMYIILWGYTRRNDIDHLHKLLKNYGENIGGSSHNNIYTQYYMGSGPSQAFITNPSNQFGGIWVDHSSIPASPSQPQIAAEALSGVAHFGYDPQGSYVVATAHEHNQAGFGSQFCAYHGYTLTTTSQLVSYTNLPYMPDAGFSCGSKIIPAPLDERGKDEGVTIVEGHEYGESVTDDAEQAPNGLAWYNYSYGEIGDMCAWWDIQNDTFGLKSYASQPMFSNATTSCVQTY